ncbi:MAG: LPS export ABC transporter permease LptG [Nitrospinae bacterium]|nr:LPS export ABC transporter permease LptG [Nitrospinota bacterium]
MKILNRYILNEYLKIFLFALTILTMLFVVVDFFEKVDDFVKYKASFVSIVKYLIFKLPLFVYYIVPITTLLSTVICMGMLSRHNEIVAMKSCGMGLHRIAMPILSTAAVISFFVFLNSEYILPATNRLTNRTFKVDIKKQEEHGIYKKNKIWFRSDDGSIWNIALLDAETGTMFEVSVFKFNDGRLKERIDSKQVKWTGSKWLFNDGWLRLFDAEGSFDSEYFKSREFPVKEKPEDFMSVSISPEEMGFKEIRDYIRKIKKEGLDATRYLVDMHIKLSFPAISFIMAIIAIPFSLRTGRQGGFTVGIGLSVVLGFTIWFIFSMGVSLGHAGKLPPFISAWGANIIFAAGGIYFLTTSRQ